jgi:hypothetical protein
MEQQQVSTIEKGTVCLGDIAISLRDYVYRKTSIEFIGAGLTQPGITIGELSITQGVSASKILQLIVYEDLLIKVQGTTYRLWIKGLDPGFMYTRPNQIFSKRERKKWQEEIGEVLASLRIKAAPSFKRMTKLAMKKTYQTSSRKIVKTRPRGKRNRTDLAKRIGLNRLQVCLLPYTSKIREDFLSNRLSIPQRVGPVQNTEKPDVVDMANKLDLTPERYLDLWDSANLAFWKFTELGPFYGSGKKGETTPTFRVSTEPVRVPSRLREDLEQLGFALWELAGALNKLPDKYKPTIGTDYSYAPPFTWRLDTILTDTKELFVNEIEVNDGADALMVGEQIAYGIQDLDESTAFYFAQAILEKYGNIIERPVKIAWIWDETLTKYIANAARMSEFVDQISEGQIKMQVILLDENTVFEWSNFNGIINSSTFTPSFLYSQGVDPSQILLPGSFSVLGNKAIFAIINCDDLQEFWRASVSKASLEILKRMLIPTNFVTSREKIIEASTNDDRVLKVYLSPERDLLECNRGVFGPWSGQADWQRAVSAFDQGAQFVSQPFIQPAQIQAYLRANGGKTIEEVDWYNRICVKYVVVYDEVFLTAAEATLGPNLVPAGRNCCFAPVVFE